MKFNHKFALLPLVAALTACGTVTPDIRKEIDKDIAVHKKAMETPLQPAPANEAHRASEVRGKLTPIAVVSNVRSGNWLKKTQVELKINAPTPLTAVVEKLTAQGLNIVSDLPLQNYTYSGRINRTDAETALKVVLISAGLDYQTDDARKLVVIKPMSSRTWNLNIGNRRSSFSSDGLSSNTSSNSTGNSGSSSSGSGSGSSSNNSTNNGSSSGSGSNSTNSGNNNSSGDSSSGSTMSSGSSSNGTNVASSEDFWSSLSKELNNRLNVLLPRNQVAQSGIGMQQPIVPAMSGMPGMQNPQMQGMPGMPPMMNTPTIGSGNAQGSELYVKRTIGTYSLNPETGAITVQAPHWILDDLDVYIKNTQEMYNTDISFTGEIVLFTSSKSDSEGFDLSAFASWAGGKYAAVVSNGALGGITMSLPSASSSGSVTAGGQTVGGPLAGMRYKNGADALQIFNAYLAQVGKVSVMQRPRISTTSGVPGEFSKKYTDYFNTVSQQAAAGGTGSAATATTNTLVPVDLGTDLRINPRIDVATGLVRAQLTLYQDIQSGTKTIPQTITVGNSSVAVNTTIPIITKQKISGEVLLRDGDLIIVGGQSEDRLSTTENGIPGQDGPMGGVLGTKNASRDAQTYYFALRVNVTKRK